MILSDLSDLGAEIKCLVAPCPQIITADDPWWVRLSELLDDEPYRTPPEPYLTLSTFPELEIPEEITWAVPPIQKPIFQILPVIVIGLIGIVAISILTK